MNDILLPIHRKYTIKEKFAIKNKEIDQLVLENIDLKNRLKHAEKLNKATMERIKELEKEEPHPNEKDKKVSARAYKKLMLQHDMWKRHYMELLQKTPLSTTPHHPIQIKKN